MQQQQPTPTSAENVNSGQVAPMPLPSYIETVPISSYTSSDEEEDCDEFFDAEEEVTVVDDIENSLKAEEIEAMQKRQQQSTEENILDMNDVMRSEGQRRTRTNSNRYLFYFIIL